MLHALSVKLWESNLYRATIASVTAIDLGSIEQHRTYCGPAEVDIEVLMVKLLVASDEAVVEELFVLFEAGTHLGPCVARLSLLLLGREGLVDALADELRETHLDVVRGLLAVLAMPIANAEVVSEVAPV